MRESRRDGRRGNRADDGTYGRTHLQLRSRERLRVILLILPAPLRLRQSGLMRGSQLRGLRVLFGGAARGR